jgi:glucosamine-6-phosphate deaminase
MKKIVCENYDEICNIAADFFCQQLEDKPDSVLGLATGSTPIGLYSELVRRFQIGKIDFSKATSFNLDEYYPIKKSHLQSYDYFMRTNLFDKVNFAKTMLPDGEASDPVIECARYDDELRAAGGIDLLLLGIGLNGRIGFNEPATAYPVNSYLVKLTESSIVANSRFFKPDEVQPTEALTMGLGGIFSSKKIILIVSGESKAPIVKKLLDEVIKTDIPASFLHLHPDVTVILDKAASCG